MAFTKKSSRLIIVDGEEYCYRISQSNQHTDSVFILDVAVQSASGSGSILKVVGLLTRDYWLDYPDLASQDDWNLYYVQIKPRQMA